MPRKGRFKEKKKMAKSMPMKYATRSFATEEFVTRAVREHQKLRIDLNEFNVAYKRD